MEHEVGAIVDDLKLPVVIGGEHTVAIGAVRACAARSDDLSVLFLDAHGDLRDDYMGTRWGHASVARRILETSPLIEVGVRSISESELRFAQLRRIPVHTWPPETDIDRLLGRISQNLTPNVYVTIDLDVLDPSIMSAVGTPEPGGMTWWDVTKLLRHVAKQANIVGFDVVELSPEEGPVACTAAAARLVYKFIGYIAAGKS